MYMDADEMDFPTPDSDVDSIEPDRSKLASTTASR